MLCKPPHDRRRCRDSLVCAFVLTLMLGSVPAQAMSTTHFLWDSISGDDLEFELPTMPTPNDFGPDFVELADVPIFENGSGPDTSNLLYFYPLSGGGGFSTQGLTNITNAYGDQLFSGTTASPAFVNGDYVLTDILTGNRLGTMHITTATAAIPEPATVVLMGLGLVGLGVAGRRKLVS